MMLVVLMTLFEILLVVFLMRALKLSMDQMMTVNLTRTWNQWGTVASPSQNCSDAGNLAQSGRHGSLGFMTSCRPLVGRHCPPKYAEQHTRQIHLMLQRINPDHDSLDCLVNQQASAVWKWAKPLLDSRQKRPGTIISYQTSLEKFYKFARGKQYYTDDNFILSPPTLQQIIRNSEQMTSWRAVIRKNYDTEEWRRRQKEMNTRITGEGVADIDSTEPATRALRLLKEAPKLKLSPQEFCVVRDYLVASLELQNDQHPGPLETLTMQDYEDRQTDQATGTVTVHAPCHKRSIAGPAPIAMSRSLEKKVSIYVEHVRLIFPSPDDRLFLTDSGKAFSDGTIGHRIAEFWLKTGKRSDIRMTSTPLRKMAATTILVSSEQERQLIHHHC
ncbi:uncharacterized protein [Montipora foliosa]|uniref:uncharacterized protein n=1 Tax=Montipora foliosa TaxID=591990 RepID=UPI0035F15B40